LSKSKMSEACLDHAQHEYTQDKNDGNHDDDGS